MTGWTPVQELRVFQGQSLRVVALPGDGMFELVFDRSGDSIDRVDARPVAERREAVAVPRCERLRPLGTAYDPTARMRPMAASGARFRTSH